MNEVRTNPFPGLRPFEYHEYELFFGREEQYEQMIGKLGETRFLAVVGTSGSGKSSVVKAGLLPALYGGLMMSAGPNWRIAEFRPKEDPIRELALALNHKRVFGDRSKENGSSLFTLNECTNWLGLCSRVSREAGEEERNPSRRIFEVLPAEKRLLLSEVSRDKDIKDRSTVVQVFNGILKTRDFYQKSDFLGVPLSSEIRDILARDQKSLTPQEVEKLNRLLLEASFPQEIAKQIEIQSQITEVSLRRGDLGLIDIAREAKMAPEENLLIVVDQFEELFRYAKISEHGPHGNQAAAFVKLLLQASAQNEIPIYVVLTMRSDYLGDCAKFWGLPEAINKGQYLIPRLTREQRRDAIKGPIGLRGAQITAQLVNQLLNDMGDDPDQLPILQHALMRTWDRWEQDHKDGEPIDLDHYTAIGRMAEALSIHADEAYDELPDDRSRELADQLFKCLTERATGRLETRRPTSVSEILAVTNVRFRDLVHVIDVFRKEGRSFLLPPERKPLRRDTLIDISHESLIRNWKRLKKWVNREVESANVYRRLVQTSRLHEQGKAGMLTDLEIEYASRWRTNNKPNVAWASRYHLDLTESPKATPETPCGEPAPINDRGIFECAMAFLDKSVDANNRKLRIRKFTKALVAASVFLVVAIGALGFQISNMNRESRVKARLTYSAEIKLAQREFEVENFAEVNRLLHDDEVPRLQTVSMNLLTWDNFFPSHDDSSLRGFEWQHLWKLSHNETSTLGKYKSSIISLAYLNTSGTLALAQRNGQIVLWDRDKGNSAISPKGAPSDILFAAFSSDRKTMAIARQDNSIALWELSGDSTQLTEKQELRTARVPPVNSLAYSPDSRFVAAGTQDGVTVWSTSGKEEPYIISLPTDKTNMVSLAFSADSQRLAIGRNQNAKVVEVTTRQEVFNVDLGKIPTKNQASPSQPAAPITCLNFSPDGQILALGRRDTSITLWALSEKGYLTSLNGHSMEVLNLAFSDENTGVMASGSRDGGIKIWNAKKFSDPNYTKELVDGQALAKMQAENKFSDELLVSTLNGHAGPVTALAFTHDRKTIVSGGEEGSVKVWSIDTKPGATSELGPGSSTSISSLAFSPSGGWLASGRNDGSAVVWNTSQGQSEGTVLVPPTSGAPKVTPVAFSKNDILAVATGDSSVTLWQMNNLNEQPRIFSGGHKRRVLALAFSADGSKLATGGEDKAVRLWDVATGSSQEVTVLDKSDAVLSLAFAPKQNILAIGTNKNTVVIWDLDRNRQAGQLVGHSDAVTSIMFSLDNSIIATGSWDTTAKLWHGRTYKPLITLHGHSQKVLSVSFFTDGKRLATAGEDGSVRLWDTNYENGEEDTRNALIRFRQTSQQEGLKPAFVVAVSPDGLTLASGNADGTVLLRYGAGKEEIAKQSQP